MRELYLHQYTVIGLLALLKVAFLFFVTYCDPLSSLHALDRDGLVTLCMPPSQYLNKGATMIFRADAPFATARVNAHPALREVKVWQEHLCRRLLFGRT